MFLGPRKAQYTFRAFSLRSRRSGCTPGADPDAAAVEAVVLGPVYVSFTVNRDSNGYGTGPEAAVSVSSPEAAVGSRVAKGEGSVTSYEDNAV